MKKKHDDEIAKQGQKRGSKYDQYYNPQTKKFECPYDECNTAYNEGKYLGRHMKKKHDDEIVKQGRKHDSKYDQLYNPATNKHECPYEECNKAFKRGYDLGYHMKKEHDTIVNKDGTLEKKV